MGRIPAGYPAFKFHDETCPSLGGINQGLIGAIVISIITAVRIASGKTLQVVMTRCKSASEKATSRQLELSECSAIAAWTLRHLSQAQSHSPVAAESEVGSNPIPSAVTAAHN
jgi:hypothetical protein